ncbi:MAG: GNAT family N-acetyltransferase, partial [Spirochaetota bacterium]
GAVHPKYQGKGITALLMVEMTKTAIQKKIKKVETNSELETNFKVQSNWDYFDTTLIKRKRSYILEI